MAALTAPRSGFTEQEPVAACDSSHRNCGTARGRIGTAAPKHTADEEQSLFQRVRALGRPGLKSVLEKISALESDHTRADWNHAEVDQLGQEWLASGSLTAVDADRFSQLVNELALLYGEHIAIEERELFPLASAVLETAEQDAMGEEMKARRGLSKVDNPHNTLFISA